MTAESLAPERTTDALVSRLVALLADPAAAAAMARTRQAGTGRRYRRSSGPPAGTLAHT